MSCTLWMMQSDLLNVLPVSYLSMGLVREVHPRYVVDIKEEEEESEEYDENIAKKIVNKARRAREEIWIPKDAQVTYIMHVVWELIPLVSIAHPSKRSRVSGGVKQGRYAMMVCSSRGGSLYEISKASFKTPQKETSGDLELGMQFSCDDRLNCDGFSLHNLSYLQKQRACRAYILM